MFACAPLLPAARPVVFHVKHSSLPPFDVSRETRERLVTFTTLLQKWSKSVNLLARGDLSALWPRHIEDSLQIAPLLAKDGSVAIDMGSGAGFPGLILAIATDKPFHLVEADKRKAAFLREVAREVKAPVQVHAVRIEAAMLPEANVVTARGLAPVTDLLALALPLLSPNGQCIFLKGRSVENELTQARRQWQMQITRWQSRTEPDACVLQISEIVLARPAGA